MGVSFDSRRLNFESDSLFSRKETLNWLGQEAIFGHLETLS